MTALAAGEMVADKLPVAPSRTEPPGLVGRTVGAATSGNEVADVPGAVTATVIAVSATFACHHGRAAVVKAGMPDPVLAVIEDLLAVALATAATRRVDPGPRVGTADSVACGVVSAIAGTVAMTVTQGVYYRVTGVDSSEAPGEVGRRIVENGLGRRAPRRRRGALNQFMHWLYGMSWGVPFGGWHSMRSSSPGLGVGFALGLGVWATSLIELPVLGLAPPPWRQDPGSLATDAAFHCVYGLASAGAMRALSSD